MLKRGLEVLKEHLPEQTTIEIDFWAGTIHANRLVVARYERRTEDIQLTAALGDNFPALPKEDILAQLRTGW